MQDCSIDLSVYQFLPPQSWAFQTKDVLGTENSLCITFKQNQALYNDTSEL
jgi:hypothetical protein